LEQLNKVCSIAAASLARQELSSELENRATQLVLLGEISRRLISLKPLDERWREIVPLLSQAFNFAQTRIYELDGDAPLLKAHSHVVELEPEDLNELEVPVTVNKALQNSHHAEAMVTGEDEIKDQLAMPMLVQDRLLGILYLERSLGVRFSGEETGLAEMLASQMAIAVLEAKNYAQQQEYTWYNTVMLEITKHAVQPGDPIAAMRAVLQLTTMLAGASWALLLIPDEFGENLTAGPASGLPRETDEIVATLQINRRDLSLGPPYQESDAPFTLSLPSPLSDALHQEQCGAMQLSDGHSLLGLLLIGGPTPSGPRRELLAGIAHQLSMRIENARLIDNLATQRSLERELETARNIQQSFMPQSLPEPENWQVGSTWMAARQVGGDFFDFIPLPSPEIGPLWGVVIADVADKGVPAALFMALCRTLLRSIAPSASNPAEALDKLNRLILTDTHADLFVSLFYAVWDPASGQFSYANGGHNPPLLIRPNKSSRFLEGSGMVLGVSERARYQNQQLTLEPGELVVMYTDGVTEAMNPDGVFFGNEGLVQAAESLQRLPAQSIAEELSQRVIQYTARLELPDDLTTLVLKRIN
jgi:serine phosphatase RsbU (regulator of sigma subunit)